jgi:hypothetical protein
VAVAKPATAVSVCAMWCERIRVVDPLPIAASDRPGWLVVLAWAFLSPSPGLTLPPPHLCPTARRKQWLADQATILSRWCCPHSLTQSTSLHGRGRECWPPRACAVYYYRICIQFFGVHQRLVLQIIDLLFLLDDVLIPISNTYCIIR